MLPCLMQCWMNGLLIAEVQKDLAPVPSETMHAIEIEFCFDDSHPIITPLTLTKINSYFDVKKSNL